MKSQLILTLLHKVARKQVLKGTELAALLYQNFNILQIYVIGQDLPVK